MDDKANQGKTQAQPVSQPQVAVQQAPPAGSVNKEAGPVAMSNISEVVRPSETEPVIEDKEVKEAGVETVTDVPKLTHEHIEAGINVSPQIAPVVTSPTGLVKPPLTEEEAKKILKFHKKISNSIVWMAAEVLRQLKIIKKIKN
ncbi:MAG: hypothetical protein M1450_01610 [Patescibacteria group bacterium]|nr:hypothetical protein [Patescibacteria group bacterium]